MLPKERWNHPGGKLRELGADRLSEAELLAILISPGGKRRPALQIAEELLARYGTLEGMAGRPLEEMVSIKGLGDVKILRIAAALEIGRRVATRRVRGGLFE